MKRHLFLWDKKGLTLFNVSEKHLDITQPFGIWGNTSLGFSGKNSKRKKGRILFAPTSFMRFFVFSLPLIPVLMAVRYQTIFWKVFLVLFRRTLREFRDSLVVICGVLFSFLLYAPTSVLQFHRHHKGYHLLHILHYGFCFVSLHRNTWDRVQA